MTAVNSVVVFVVVLTLVLPCQRLVYLSQAGLDSTYTDYGRQCAPHDANICETTYPNAAHDMWCCMSWCWVDQSCPHARASTQWPGKFFSTAGCEMDADVVSSCKYSRVCERLGTSRIPGPSVDSYAEAVKLLCRRLFSTAAVLHVHSLP